MDLAIMTDQHQDMCRVPKGMASYRLLAVVYSKK